MQYAPIALFTYNRPDKTKRVIESLIKNEEAKFSDLYIFSDGPKNEKAVEGVKLNREFLREFKSSLCNTVGHEEPSFQSITIIEREKNWGLANSLIAGITEIVNKYGRIIVVEDDLVVSPYFLRFMNDGLEKYKEEDRIGAISAYIPPIADCLPETFFTTYFHCWGWATWKRGWDLLNTDTRMLLKRMRFKKNKFDVGGAYGNLYCQKIGLVDSWWVRLYASFYLEDKLILYPGHTMVSNSGLDGSGTHSKVAEPESSYSIAGKTPICVNDIEIRENINAYNTIKRYFEDKSGKSNVLSTFKSFLRRLLYIDCK